MMPSHYRGLRTTGFGTCLIIAFLICASPARAVVHGDLLRIGYPATTGAAIRVGAWTPVVVQLRLEGAASFSGYLRLRQFDRDRDLAEDTVPVTLRSDAGGATEYTLYTVFSGQVDEERLRVELINTDTADGAPRMMEMFTGGQSVRGLAVQSSTQNVSDDDYLILSLSEGQLGKLRLLHEEQASKARFDRAIHVAHGPPSMIPNLGLGLESIDAIVWENADPTLLTETQSAALLEWVQRGGRLVLAAGRTGAALAQSTTFGPLLPVDIGAVAAHTELPEVRARLLGARDSGVYRQPVTVASCTLRTDEGIREYVREEACGAILSERRVGMGRIVFIAASLQELLDDAAAQPEQFFRPILGLRDNPISDDKLSVEAHALFGQLEAEIGFQGAGSAYLALALGFACIYTLASTLGAWKLLERRNMLRHTWTSLAAMAIVASLLSIIAVRAVHGYSRRVHQVTVVDGIAGSTDAAATAWFGLTTPTVTRLDLWLPDDVKLRSEPAPSPCMLRPLPEWRASLTTDSGYSDPAQYSLRPATAELHEVPMRATLKQLEGGWRGQLNGTIRADLKTADQPIKMRSDDPAGNNDAYLLTPESWIENGLDVDLEDCCLIVAQDDVYSGNSLIHFPQRSANDRVRVYPLGMLKHDERKSLSSVIGAKPADDLNADKLAAWSLDILQKKWASNFIGVVPFNLGGEGGGFTSSMEAYKHSVLMLTVLGDVDPVHLGANTWGAHPTFSRARCRTLDRSDSLGRHMALLVGFSSAVPPVRLCARTGDNRYTPLDVPRARTAYRFLVPVAAPPRKPSS
jgi:hypothetical protein